MILNNLRKRCLQSIDSLMSEGVLLRYYPERLSFIDRGSNILAVAHCDTVQQNPYPFTIKNGKVHNPKLDDRLGVWIILDLLPSIGINVDVLLTDNEEVGASTAQFFDPIKQYNWIVEFDRRGEDVVLYNFYTSEYASMMEDHGFKVGRGLFTDISYMEHLGCFAFNVGVGYQNYHSKDSFADLGVLKRQIASFETFYEQYKDTYLPHNPKNDYYDFFFIEDEEMQECFECQTLSHEIEYWPHALENFPLCQECYDMYMTFWTEDDHEIYIED